MANEIIKADPDRALISEVAMDIGKEAVSHLRTMYPAAYAALGKSGAVSLRNTVHNQIMAALDTTDADEIAARLERRRKHRREMHRQYDEQRNAK
jgi:DNA topoisomerase IB